MSLILLGYLQMNILVVTGFAIFKVARWTALRAKINYQWLTRLAQIILIGGVFLPPILGLLPTNQLPQLKFETFRPVREMYRAPKIQELSGPVRRVANAPTALAESHSFKNLFVAVWKWETLVLIWFVGFLLCVSQLVRNIIHLRRFLQSAFVLRRIGRVAVVVTESAVSPFSTLHGRSAYVVLPLGILKNPRDFQIAVQHEFQHHRSFDTAWALAIEVGVCLFYCNPAIYLWKKEIRELQEFSCDEALIGQRGVSVHEYGSTLIRVAEAALGKRPVLVGTASMAAGPQDSRDFKSFLRRRIEMLSDHQSSSRKKFVLNVLGTICICATVTVAYGAQQLMKKPERVIKVNPGQAVFNPTIQSIAEDVLGRALKSYQAKAGFVLVSDPLTGKLLAAANISNAPTTGGKSWSLSYFLEPASVIKGIMATAAVDRRQVKFSEKFNCEDGSYLYGHNVFHDWKPFHELTAAETIMHSSNICGIKIGQRLASEGLARALSDFGFGPGGTAQDFPEARPGQLPTTAQLGEEEYVALISTGYSIHTDFKVTPLEIIQAYGAIANDGKLMKPIAADQPDAAASVLRQALAPETAREARLVLQRAVLEGTGKPAQSKLYTTAGKTGTAFTPGTIQHESLGGERSIASFAGFAPVEQPRVVIYVAVIGPTKPDNRELAGSTHAAPIFREVSERVLKYLNVPPDKI